MQECCFKGFEWEGTPSGQEDKIAGRRAYVTGESKTHAVLIGHDALGWEWKNTRLLADHFAKEVGATVYLPDFFDGFTVSPDDIKMTIDENGNPVPIPTYETFADLSAHRSAGMEVLNKDFDFGTWVAANSVDKRVDAVLECATKLRENYSWLGYTGYCWGGGMGFRIATRADLFSNITVAHSATPPEEEIKAIKVPFQIIAAEYDFTFPTEVKEMCNREIPKLGVDYLYHHFPGVSHGFATKIDERVPDGKRALALAKNAVVFWMVNHK